MIRFFNDYCNQLFPSISTEVKNAVRQAVSNINMSHSTWFMSSLLSKISQGDIIDKLPFKYYSDEGNEITFISKGMVLSNTCDLQRDPYIVIAPLFSISDGNFNSNVIMDIKDNVVTGKMGFKASSLEDYFVDFSKCNSFNREVIMRGIKLDKIHREFSLTQYACYMLYIKLTIYFMRIENYEWFESRNKGI